MTEGSAYDLYGLWRNDFRRHIDRRLASRHGDFNTVPLLLNRFYKGVVREIVIVKKREAVRDFFSPGFVGRNHSGVPRKSSYTEVRHTSVDYRIKGKKLLHTKFCPKELMKKLTVGETYTVRIRLNDIIKIYRKH